MTRSVPAGTPQHLRSWMGRRAQRSRRIGVVLVALVAVIATSWSGTALAADHSHATIRVSVGGDRSGLTTVLGLQGVVLSLYEGQQSPTDKVEGEWATCTSDSSGLCEFEVPIAEVDKNFRPWVVQESAPTGWYMNSSLRTGGADSESSVATGYYFRLKSRLVAGTIYRSDMTGSNGFMLSSTASYEDTTRNASGGVWQQSRENPDLPAKCGLDMALVLDLSGSVYNSGQLSNLKGAATTITNSLVGTQSRAALFSFSEP